MIYQQGSVGRVFLIKFDDEDDLLEEIKRIAAKEKIKVGTIMLLGGMRSAGIVSGPKEAVIPPEPMWTHFDDGREVLGFGTLLWKDTEPIIHLHGAMGREKETLTGCIRKGSSVYLVIEGVITEIVGVNAQKALNEKTGLVMLEMKNTIERTSPQKKVPSNKMRGTRRLKK
jgi:predicted DNA-binding protein with PD1-like motif